MRYLLAALVGVALLGLAACGGSSAQDDPFVGTWRPVDSPDSYRLVIAAADAGYDAFIYTLAGNPQVVGPMHLQTDVEDVLVFPAQNGVEQQTFTFHRDSGRLTNVDGSDPGLDFELVSRSTSHPPVTSQPSAPDETW